jgi:hypothetical protein
LSGFFGDSFGVSFLGGLKVIFMVVRDAVWEPSSRLPEVSTVFSA